MKRLATALLLLSSLLFSGPSSAVTPSEVLDDPVLEARAREISKGLRCLVCRNENIDDSNAQLASDLRVLVRERLVAGDNDEEVVDYIVDRYGEYVLLKPTATGANLILWIAGPAMLLIAAAVGVGYVRGRRGAPDVAAEGLSPEEEARLKDLLKE
ncbi:cytochrome c-type biogenesis protein [Tropicimonas sp. IMCC6043]|uniref:cytochrome c-type biogenesis protein n=1 Tax=Tropicimonas sp. IMCC6043 TaxID=2510645 RepID=UPI00101C71EF|nr:cytochrome c-type biogenesis protein [Tropicimonas sp. IMCC6043]RYH09803.1 cytochrome c-type biogenesis protein CcmH [Tropicimonas sp. IMCC6043]